MDTQSLVALGGFLAAAFAVASSGAIFRPGKWYFEELRKPAWNPPSWLFAPAWTLLYIMIAVSGWLVWREVGFAGAPLAFVAFAAQLVLNALWSALFFGLKRPDLALVEVVALWAAILANILLFAPISSTAAWLLVPYLLWVSFASVLNAALWRLNRPFGRPARAGI